MTDVALPERQLRTMHLFAGAGGGIIADLILGHIPVCAVEYAAYPRSVLLARQRDGILSPFPVWEDVTTFDGRQWQGRVDVVSGGFPCQDISIAGKGDGLDGERSGLWTEMARIIGEVQPRFAFVENSPMLTSRGLNRVLGDLSEMGYSAEYGIVGADDAGAPHRRERIWILAYANGINANGCGPRASQIFGGKRREASILSGCENESQHPIGSMADPDLCGRLHGQAEIVTTEGREHAQREPIPSGEDVANAASERESRNKATAEQGVRGREMHAEPGNAPPRNKRGHSSEWTAQPGLGREIDGLAEALDAPWSDGWEDGTPRVATGIPNRADRLKAIGNGQCPQAAVLAWNTLMNRINQPLQ